MIRLISSSFCCRKDRLIINKKFLKTLLLYYVNSKYSRNKSQGILLIIFFEGRTNQQLWCASLILWEKNEPPILSIPPRQERKIISIFLTRG